MVVNCLKDSDSINLKFIIFLIFLKFFLLCYEILRFMILMKFSVIFNKISRMVR